MSMINVEIKKTGHENAMSLIRRFSRKMQEAGIIPKVKGNRYNERDISKLAQKNMALRKMARRIEVERLKKLGKM
jgi:ribosomal protein S21